MTHPSEATLALFAGRDLGWIAGWRTRRHVAGCERCRREVDAFCGAREEITELHELPGLSWNRLAAEIKANIRVGLAAGECVGDERSQPRLFAGPRPLVACASVALLLVMGLWLVRPVPAPSAAARQEGTLLWATGNGVEVREGERSFALMHRAAGNVIYSAGAQGSMRARYVDPDTSYVTINTVYVH